MKKTMATVLVGALYLVSLTGSAATAAPSGACDDLNNHGRLPSLQLQVSASTPAPAPVLTPTVDDQDGDGIPDTAEKVLGTNPYNWDTNGNGTSDKDDAKPAFTDNPIVETSATALPIELKDARVEDNTAADPLEITLRNTGAAALDTFDIYFSITDKVDGTVEGYYVKLDGLSIPAGESTTLHFDNDVTQSGHYFGNMNGLYRNSSNGLTFAVQLHAAGYAPLNFTTEKSEGTAEVAD